MRRSLPLLLALTACATAPAPKPEPAPAPPPPAPIAKAEPAPAPKPPEAKAPEGPIPFRPLKTPAPMETVLLPVDNDPIVSFRLVFHTGSVDDPKGKEGLTALTARLMAEGGTQSLDSAQLTEALFPMAAELSASTSEEFTVFEGRVHKDFLDKYLPIFADVLTAPRLDPKELDRLRTDAINTLRTELRGEDDETLGKVLLQSQLYPDHPYRHFVGGTVEGLKAVTLEDVQAQLKRVFSQDRLVVGLGGAVDQALADALKAKLAALPAKGAPQVVLPPAPAGGGQVRILQKDSLSTAISIGEAIDVRRGDPDYPALAFAVSYLGEHRQFSGRLMQELREHRGLNYGDYAYPEAFEQAGYTTFPQTNVGRAEQSFSIWLRPVEPKNAVFATRAALYYLNDLLESGIAPDAFALTQKFVTGYTKLWELTDQRRLGYAIDDRFYGTHDFLESYRKAVAQLTPEEVHAAVKRHLSLARLDFAYVTQDAEGLTAQLTSGQPSPIEYPSPKPAEVLEVDKAIVGFPLPIHPDAIQTAPADQFMAR